MNLKNLTPRPPSLKGQGEKETVWIAFSPLPSFLSPFLRREGGRGDRSSLPHPLDKESLPYVTCKTSQTA